MSTAIRTQEEIAERIGKLMDGSLIDAFGFRREVLLDALDFEHARPFLVPEATQEDWEPADKPDQMPKLTREAIMSAATSYLEFAFGKASDHRGLSASRSVDKLTEFGWLLTVGPGAMSAFESAGYTNYGVPKLMAFARTFELPIPDDATLQRMGEGKPCRPDCMEGCGAE